MIKIQRQPKSIKYIGVIKNADVDSLSRVPSLSTAVLNAVSLCNNWNH
jgi:hypothetical protein